MSDDMEDPNGAEIEAGEDETDDVFTNEQNNAAPPDAYAVLVDLLALVADAKAAKRRLRELRQAEAALVAARGELDDAQLEHEVKWAKDRAELEAERAAVQKRALAVAAREASVEARHQTIAKLERAWRNLGEPESVISGFQAPEFSAIEKARRAHRGVVEHDDLAPSQAESPAGVRFDRHGQAFPADTTLTHQPDPADAPPARVRIRRPRNAASPEAA
jgi:hypothetical protein